MQVDFSQIAEIDRGELSFSLSVPIEEILPTPPDSMKFSQPVTINGVLKKDEDGLSISAVATTRVEGVCSLCLKDVAVDVTCPVEERLSSEETDIITGNCIDLAEILASCLLTYLPMKLVCREDCKGLCPVCGKDRNTGDCGCNTARIDPRFEQLRALFKLDEEV